MTNIRNAGKLSPADHAVCSTPRDSPRCSTVPARAVGALAALALLCQACGHGNEPATTPESVGQFKPGTAWDIQLNGAPTSANLEKSSNPEKMIEIDLEENSKATVLSLKAQGIKVVCYFSAGSYENWRSDASQLPLDAIGNENGWPGENWLDIRNPDVLKIMIARIDVAHEKGCDAVDPDNVDGYQANTGFDISADSQMAFLDALVDAAHTRGLAIALKNDGDLLADHPELAQMFDFAVIEECLQFDECGKYKLFAQLDKAIFAIEYNAELFDCEVAAAAAIELILLAQALDNSRFESCTQ